MFGSDNQAGAHDTVMRALAQANAGRAGAYGDDDWTRAARAELARVFESDDFDVYFVGTGGAANGLALACLCPSWGAVLAHDQAHVMLDEGNGPQFFTDGARCVGIGQGDAKLRPVHVREAASRLGGNSVHGVQPLAVTLTNLSENGLVYRSDEVKALADECHDAGWKLHVDGARFANAVAASGTAPADLSWRSGVDALSFGLTKLGAIAAEAIILFGDARTQAAPFLRKRAGQLFSKQRYFSAQFLGLLQGDVWLDLARHANGMAQGVASQLMDAGCVLAVPCEGNEVFARLSPDHIQALRAAGIGFFPWAPLGDDVFRFVTSWSTTADDIACLGRALTVRV